MDKYLAIRKAFETKADKSEAVKMSKYMKDNFKFYGIPVPERKKSIRTLLKKRRNQNT